MTQSAAVSGGPKVIKRHLNNLYCRRFKFKMTLVVGRKNKLMFLIFRLKSCKINFKLKYVPRLLVWLALYIIQNYVTTFELRLRLARGIWKHV